MRASQTQINQDVAVALERVVGELKELQSWRKEMDEERRDYVRRRADRTDQRFQIDRASVAMAVAVLASLVQLWPHLH